MHLSNKVLSVLLPRVTPIDVVESKTMAFKLRDSNVLYPYFPCPI